MNRRYITKEQLAQCINNSPYQKFSLAQLRLWMALYGQNEDIIEDTEQNAEGGNNI